MPQISPSVDHLGGEDVHAPASKERPIAVGGEVRKRGVLIRMFPNMYESPAETAAASDPYNEFAEKL